jgi:hypothetical protein
MQMEDPYPFLHLKSTCYWTSGPLVRTKSTEKNPAVVKAYRNSIIKALTFGVSLDDTKADWLAAIKRMDSAGHGF